MSKEIYRGHDLIPADDELPGQEGHVAIYEGSVLVGTAPTMEDAYAWVATTQSGGVNELSQR